MSPARAGNTKPEPFASLGRELEPAAMHGPQPSGRLDHHRGEPPLSKSVSAAPSTTVSRPARAITRRCGSRPRAANPGG